MRVHVSMHVCMHVCMYVCICTQRRADKGIIEAQEDGFSDFVLMIKVFYVFL